jgi:nicotinamidase-related amidase
VRGWNVRCYVRAVFLVCSGATSSTEDGKTVVASPHKIYGPQSNDLVLQLRKRGIGKVIVGGMVANMCVEAHMRELLEQGFDIAVVKDATAAPRPPVWGDGYTAALINFTYLAKAVMTTDEVIDAMQRAQKEGTPRGI